MYALCDYAKINLIEIYIKRVDESFHLLRIENFIKNEKLMLCNMYRKLVSKACR